MKHISLLVFLLAFSASTLAQEVVIDTSYYTPPAQRRRILRADPDQNPGGPWQSPNSSDRNREVGKDHLPDLAEVQTWYVSAEGGFRNDASTLSNSFGGLMSNPSSLKSVWGALLGYTYRNAWSVEAGYTHAPTHLTISIANGQSPLVFTYQNAGFGIPVRLKRRIGSARRAANGTGFWLTAGAWLIPNGDSQMDGFQLIGYSRNNRLRTTDTLRLNNTTTLARISGLAEVGVDYTVRVSPFLELGFYLRKYWGLGNALRSDVVYKVNSTSETRSSLTANGTGLGFGVALRYIYGRQHELKKAARLD
ncbi:hypothetical protein [Spirosoma koreense]